MADGAKRRLAAVLFADVVGYSALMGSDEAGAIGAFEAVRRDLAEPLAAAHDGRIVKYLGDGFLAVFDSGLEAVRFAVDMQQGLASRDEEPKLEFRIGVDLGDVVEAGGDVLGEGVNIAARLQALADPGGVCVSDAAFAQADGKIAAPFTAIGPQKLKNISRLVSVHVLRTKAPERPTYLGKTPFVDLPTEKFAVITGGCLCGRVRYEVSEPDLGSIYCHCSMCRRATGGPFNAGVTVARSATRWTGAEPKYYRSSNIAERGFCPECGSSICYKSLVGEWRAWYLLMFGSLDTPERHQPTFHLGAEGEFQFLKLPDGFPRMTCKDSPSLQEAYGMVGEQVP